MPSEGWETRLPSIENEDLRDGEEWEREGEGDGEAEGEVALEND